MNIGILTFHRAINYGAYMQAYSLANRLQKDFPQDKIEIVDYNHKKRENFIRKCPIVFLYRRSIKEGIEKYIQTKEFKRSLKYLNLSKRFLGCKNRDIEKYISQRYDMIIVGSDAVFNWNDIGIPNPYFLSETKCRNKLSYAASAHLQKYNNISDTEKKYLINALNDFCYIGVRDDNTAKFVDELLGITKATHNCDPSIFLKLDFSKMNLIKKLKKHKFNFNKKTVFVMLMNSQYGKFVKRFFGDEYQIVALMDGNKYADIYLYNLNPFEWSHVFQYGNCLVTDYFHATIFGLKNGIPVMSIDASKYCSEEYESKAKDLLVSRLDLSLMYMPADRLEGENGYTRFKDKMTDILNNYDNDKVDMKLKHEAESYNDFYKMVNMLHKESV